MKGFGIFLYVLAATFAIAAVVVAYKGAGRACLLFVFAAVFAYKWGRNCYYDLRHDQRDDSLPWWNRYF